MSTVSSYHKYNRNETKFKLKAAYVRLRLFQSVLIKLKTFSSTC